MGSYRSSSGRGGVGRTLAGGVRLHSAVSASTLGLGHFHRAAFLWKWSVDVGERWASQLIHRALWRRKGQQETGSLPGDPAPGYGMRMHSVSGSRGDSVDAKSWCWSHRAGPLGLPLGEEASLPLPSRPCLLCAHPTPAPPASPPVGHTLQELWCTALERGSADWGWGRRAAGD